LAATNRDLEAAEKEGTFRQDLLYRLNVIELTVPPLRDRPDDILPLARRFISFFSSKYDQSIEGLTPDAGECLQAHSWSGNVRELRNVIERAVILAKQRRIGTEHLSLTDDTNTERSGQVGELVSLETIEEAHLRRVVEATETLDKAAEVLGIDPATLYRKRRKYGFVGK
jgi:NtrC-family two-component system response regulator AlgB